MDPATAPEKRLECTHGWDPFQYPAGEECDSFIDTVLNIFEKADDGGILEAYGKTDSLFEAVEATEERHPEVWQDVT